MAATFISLFPVADVMLIVTPGGWYYSNPHISDGKTEALEKLLTQGYTAASARTHGHAEPAVIAQSELTPECQFP